MAHTIGGDGLIEVENALGDLEQYPQLLARARRRFSRSPPSYAPSTLHNSTLTNSPNPPTEEHQRREERLTQLRIERNASTPYHQFGTQCREEEERILEAHRNRIRSLPVGANFVTLAEENVRKQWIEQGIWNNKWSPTAANAVWKHQKPLDLEDISYEPQPKPIPQKSDEEKRRVSLEREREASRPFYQFIFQVSKERERIQDESESGEVTSATAAAAASPDINTRACENIQNTWVKRKIWNIKWGILPGMSWKHEEPEEEETTTDPAPVQGNPLSNDTKGAGEVSFMTNMHGDLPRQINGDPVTDTLQSGVFIINSPSAETNIQEPGIIYPCGSPADVNLSRLENDSTVASLSEPKVPTPKQDRPARRTAERTIRTRRKNPSHTDRQIPAVASSSLEPSHSPEISKAATKKGSGPQGSSISPIARPDVAEQLLQTARIPPRRSKRLQHREPSVAIDLAEINSTDPHKANKVKAQSKPKRAGERNLNSAAKPQGIPIKQRSRTSRRRTRK